MKSCLLLLITIQSITFAATAATMTLVKATQEVGQWKKMEGEKVLVSGINGTRTWYETKDISFEATEAIKGVMPASFIMIRLSYLLDNWIEGQVYYLFQDGTAVVRTDDGEKIVNVITDRSKLSFSLQEADGFRVGQKVFFNNGTTNKITVSRIYDNGMIGVSSGWFFAKSKVEIGAVDFFVGANDICASNCR